MNKQNMLSIPDENKIEELLGKIQPLPGRDFHKKMEQAQWRTKTTQSKANSNMLRFKYVVAIFITLTITLLAVTPQGRTLAQEAVHFFQRISSPTVQLSDEQARSLSEAMDRMDKPYDIPLIPVIIPPIAPEMASIPSCETPQKAQSYHCQVALAESKLGIDLKEFPEKPNNWELESLYIHTNSQYVVMSYRLDFKYIDYNNNGFTSYSNLVFIQVIGDPFMSESAPWGIVPGDEVESVNVGTYKGEYVKGSFNLSTDNNELTWTKSYRDQTLAWSDGNRWYLIQYSPNLNIAEYWPDLNPTGTMGKNELIQLAESLTNSSITTNEALNPNRLLSISDAEKISGLDLKTPTLLPMDMDFQYARYLPDEQQVQLFYGINEDLIIHEWEGQPVDYKKPLGKYEYTCENVNMNGNDALFCFFESKNLRSFLWWHKDGVNYQMYYNDSLVSGGRINREQMLLIAESMQDFDDFYKKGNRTYEQTVIYAQALGIDLKKFSVVPSGWAYNNFWSDAKEKCIDLIYKSTTGNSTLALSQCGTENRSNISGFPSKEISQVKVGNAKGQYITGEFSITDDGKQVWDPTLPVKQLYWQQDGLWIHITLYGDQALITDKEDLITLAENLQ